jgi:hypothetical protein
MWDNGQVDNYWSDYKPNILTQLKLTLRNRKHNATDENNRDNYPVI